MLPPHGVWVTEAILRLDLLRSAPSSYVYGVLMYKRVLLARSTGLERVHRAALMMSPQRENKAMMSHLRVS